jgi:hypothetical protein
MVTPELLVRTGVPSLVGTAWPDYGLEIDD